MVSLEPLGENQARVLLKLFKAVVGNIEAFSHQAIDVFDDID